MSDTGEEEKSIRDLFQTSDYVRSPQSTDSGSIAPSGMLRSGLGRNLEESSPMDRISKNYKYYKKQILLKVNNGKWKKDLYKWHY